MINASNVVAALTMAQMVRLISLLLYMKRDYQKDNGKPIRVKTGQGYLLIVLKTASVVFGIGQLVQVKPLAVALAVTALKRGPETYSSDVQQLRGRRERFLLTW